ncbi:MAG: NTP transferase domain-containing protein [Planctomycetota bacterium]
MTVATLLVEQSPLYEDRRIAMIKLERMLMIGSAGSKVGKTELACALIKRLSKTTEIVGIKVTTIKAKGQECPRGGEGCGVCASLDGSFVITEETDRDSNKDTARLLKAGAARVFWLRVIGGHIEDGMSSLLEVMGPNAISVCESNSLRQVVEPGLFIMVQGPGRQQWKSSARAVKEYADKIVTSDGSSFDLDTEQIRLTARKWAMTVRATAIIMAGGKSARIGRDKSMLTIGAKPMIEHIYEQVRPNFDQVLVSASNVSEYDFLPVELVRDRQADQGPLMGICSALQASANEVNFVIACDIPQVDMVLVRKMLRFVRNHDAVIPVTGPSRYEPLFAVYKKSVLPAVEKTLAAGKRKIMDALANCKVKYVEAAEAGLRNINTMDEYYEFVKRQSDADV